MSLHPDKKPFRILRRWTALIAGMPVKHVEYEADLWVGPDSPGGPMGYQTVRSIVNAANVRTYVAPSVSFWPELSKALG